MSINNIILPDTLIRELYKDNLVAPSVPASPLAPPSFPVSAVPASSVPASSLTTSPVPASSVPASSLPTSPVAASSVPASSGLESQSPGSLATSPTSAPAAYRFLGSNRRKTTIVVKSMGAAFLPDDQLAFLTRILEACQMNIGDVAIVNQATTPVTITELRQQLQPVNIFLFGVEPVAIRLPIQFPLFKIQPYDQCNYLYAPNLEELVGTSQESKLLKSKLWVCLKQLFEL